MDFSRNNLFAWGIDKNFALTASLFFFIFVVLEVIVAAPAIKDAILHRLWANSNKPDADASTNYGTDFFIKPILMEIIPIPPVARTVIPIVWKAEISTAAEIESFTIGTMGKF